MSHASLSIVSPFYVVFACLQKRLEHHLKEGVQHKNFKRREGSHFQIRRLRLTLILVSLDLAGKLFGELSGALFADNFTLHG